MGSIQSLKPDAQRSIFFEKACNIGRFESNTLTTTKYNCFTFFPKVLFYEFNKPANAFYLLVFILQCVSVISAFSPIASLPAFAIVVLQSLARQAMQDLVKCSIIENRRKSDRKVNQTASRRLCGEQFVECMWQDIQVGDFVKVHTNEQFPADLLLLYSTEENGVCYVETSNLDGERNLKIKTVSSDICVFPQQYCRVRGALSCSPPNKNIHEFTGVQQIDGSPPTSLSSYNLLLRCTTLKNTEWVVGMVVYAGMKSKILMNFPEARRKVSAVQKKVHRIQLALFVVLYLIILVTCCMYYREYYGYKSRDNIFYLRSKYHWSISKDAGILSLTLALLLANFVTVAMNLSLDLQKSMQGSILADDTQMSFRLPNQEKQLRYCKVQNSSMVEQLGNVEYVLSDKTGTLTSNEMVFKHMWTDGSEYSAECMLENKQRLLCDPKFVQFWTALVLCHEAVADTRTHEYHSTSSDQVCLLQFARALGFVFKKRTRVSVEVEMFGQKRVYEILLMLPFSERKMMSVVVRDIETQLIVALTKGADNMMFRASSQVQPLPYLASLQQAVTKFSKMGLRTLVFGIRTIPIDEFKAISQQHTAFRNEKARNTLSKEDEKKWFYSLTQKIERELLLLGTSAIEDKLQEGVPRTIERLQEAGIKVVMITGDKLETAENIGVLSNFIQPHFAIYRVMSDADVQVEVARIDSDIRDRQVAEFSILIEGAAIQRIIECDDKSFLADFADIASRCKSLIFCRSTPSQKGSIVQFFKKRFRKTVLAIGDGGNDMNMINAADIGIGLVGKEGNQAASASDFSFCQFRFLDRLLLHHGRWVYYRVGNFFVYYGYKNLVACLLMAYYLMYCGWSGNSIFSAAYLICYNSFVSIFILFAGAYDQDINPDTAKSAQQMLPAFYKDYKRRNLFSYKRYLLWSFGAVVTSIWVFFVSVYALAEGSLDSSGRSIDARSLSSILSTTSFLLITIFSFIDLRSFTVATASIFAVMALVGGAAFFILENFANIGQNYLAWSDNFNLKWWMILLLNVSTVAAFRVAWNTLRVSLWPTLVEKYRDEHCPSEKRDQTQSHQTVITAESTYRVQLSNLPKQSNTHKSQAGSPNTDRNYHQNQLAPLGRAVPHPTPQQSLSQSVSSITPFSNAHRNQQYTIPPPYNPQDNSLPPQNVLMRRLTKLSRL